ncbi:hypothetical protein EHV23_08610 [Lautropia dentalis]|uniref:Secreted protein n=1 Tax=Lautropia dentalis TaxID=2490857 RepID=A0A426FLS3_9BURK|nr:hypothetical protein EHV23_08610 [Lautropia dentalis]
MSLSAAAASGELAATALTAFASAGAASAAAAAPACSAGVLAFVVRFDCAAPPLASDLAAVPASLLLSEPLPQAASASRAAAVRAT